MKLAELFVKLKCYSYHSDGDDYEQEEDFSLDRRRQLPSEDCKSFFCL